MGTGVGRWEETHRRRAEWGTTRMGLGGSGRGTKGLAVDQPWNIDEVDETTGASSLVQDSPVAAKLASRPLAVVAATK